MTLEMAQEIRELMTVRNLLISDLERFQECDSITGNINKDSNGLGFRWDKNSREIKCLIDGIERQIQYIEETISNIK